MDQHRRSYTVLVDIILAQYDHGTNWVYYCRVQERPLSPAEADLPMWGFDRYTLFLSLHTMLNTRELQHRVKENASHKCPSTENAC